MVAENYDYKLNHPDEIEIQPRSKIAPQKGPYGENVITVDGLKADESTQKVALKTLSTQQTIPTLSIKSKTARLDSEIEAYTRQLLEELNKGEDCNIDKATKLLQQLITAGHAANGVDWKIDANELEKMLKEVTIKKQKNHQNKLILFVEVAGGVISIAAGLGGCVGIGLASFGVAAGQGISAIGTNASYIGTGVSNLSSVGKSWKQGELAVLEFTSQQLNSRKDDRYSVYKKYFEDSKAQAQRIDGREQNRQGTISNILRS